MDKFILAPLALAVALSGCSHATRSSSTDTMSASSTGVYNDTATTSTNGAAATNGAYSNGANTAAGRNVNYGNTATNNATGSSPGAYSPTADSASSTREASSSTPSSGAATNSPSMSGSTYASNQTTGTSSVVSGTTSSVPAAAPSGVASSTSTSATAPAGSTYASTADQSGTRAGSPGMPDSTAPAGDTSALSSSSRDVSARITAWHLAPADIQSDLDHSMTIVRTRQAAPGTPAAFLDDSVVITLVKSRLQADSDLSALNLDVQAHNGEVQLGGTAQSAAQVGRAIALALDTEGVTKVSSAIKLGAPAK